MKDLRDELNEDFELAIKQNLDSFEGKLVQVLCGLWGRGVVWTIDGSTPGLDVTAIATASGLLSYEEAHVVVRVIRGLKAS